MLLITFDFFYAVAELVWMESVSVASKVRDSLTTRFLREIRFAKSARKIFRKTDLSVRSCKSVDSENAFATENKFIRHRPEQTKRKEEKIIGEKHREKSSAKRPVRYPVLRRFVTSVENCRIMQNYLIGQQEPCIADLLERMEKTEKALDRQLKKAVANRVFGGERFLSDVQLSQRLHISRRTLQDYRSAGALPYYLVSGKVIYKESDIQRMLEKAYRPPFDRRNLL